MDLGIVPQRLEVAHPLHRVFDGLFIEYFPVVQGDVQAEPVLRQASENLQLDLTHKAHMDLASLIVELQLGVLLQLPQLLQGRHGVTVRRQVHPVGHDALQHSLGGLGNIPQGLSGVGAGEARYRSQLSGPQCLRLGELIPGVQPQLNGLFLQGIPFLVDITQS